MIVTDIKQQIKQTGRYSVFVDGKYSFSLSELGIINNEIKIGLELTKADLIRLKQESSFDKAYSRVLNLLARRPRSEWEVRDYLKRKKENTDTIEKLVSKLNDRRLLNDLTFAQAWVENRRLLKNMSKRKLTQELRAKHVRDEIIDEVMGQDEADEREVLKDLIMKKRTQSRYSDELKLMQYLARQGFNYGDIKAALSELNEN
jgi:regulatory protein